MQRILIGGIICFAPVLVYCLLLIGLNSRRRASIIPGPWDFAGVLLATSGFLLGGGPLILSGFNSGWRRFVVSGDASNWRSFSGEGDALALGIWALYFIFLIAGASWLLWRRRNHTVLYNVDTEHFPAALEWIFGRLGIGWQRSENRYDLQKPYQDSSAPWMPGTPPDSVQKLQCQPNAARLFVHVLPSNRNVTMHWSVPDPEIRAQVEAEISRMLVNIKAEDNPALSWMVSAATTLFGLMVFGIVFAIVMAVRIRYSIGR